MVIEISPRTFQCERVGCGRNFTPETPVSPALDYLGARHRASTHEDRDSEHIRVIDLSTLKPRPDIPDDYRSGFITVCLQRTGIELLSTGRLDRDMAELEAACYAQSLLAADRIRECCNAEKDRLERLVATNPAYVL